MSKHKNVESVAHAAQAPVAAPPAAVAAEVAPAEVVAPVAAPVAAKVEAPAAAVAPAVTPAPVAAAARAASTLYSVGVTWAQKGIGLGKTALEGLARALERTAQRLGELQTQIKANVEKTAL